MLTRHYEFEATASIYFDARPVYPTDLVKAIIDQLKTNCPSDDNGKWNRAVDVGCGSGQLTFMLAEHFNQVNGFDISEAQINEAKKRNKYDNVSFQVSPAESLPVEDNSVQLITACECLHYFDLKRFNEEMDRLLAPGGIFAVIGYYPNPIFTKVDDPCYPVGKLNQLFEHALETFEKAGFPVKVFVNQIHSKYRNRDLPFDRVVYEQSFKTTVTRPASYLLDLITSIGTSEFYKEKSPEGSQALMTGIIKEIQDLFKVEDISSVQLNATFEFFVILFKK